jgi:dTMP kinase
MRERVDALHDLMIGVEPDLTVLIDMDPSAGLSRAKARATVEERFEDFGISLQEQMREGFLALSREYADRFTVIDGNRDMDAVALDIQAQVEAALA